MNKTNIYAEKIYDLRIEMPIHTDTQKEILEGLRLRYEFYKEMLMKFGPDHEETKKAEKIVGFSLQAVPPGYTLGAFPEKTTVDSEPCDE